jgi:four helix bundle protein
MIKQNAIQNRTFQFALEIIQLYIKMIEQKEYTLSRQLVRAGTSIGANVEEAIAGQSRADFISKMNIALKEGRETYYWLRLLKESNHYKVDFTKALDESSQINNIIGAIVRSTKSNTPTKK